MKHRSHRMIMAVTALLFLGIIAYLAGAGAMGDRADLAADTLLTEEELLALGVIDESAQSAERHARISVSESAKKPGEVYIGFSQCSMDNAYFASEVRTAERYCQSQGIPFIYIDAGDDPLQQSVDIKTLIAMEVDAIIVDAKDAETVAEGIKQAAAAGIMVVGIDGQIEPTAPIVTLINASPFENGYLCGQWMAGQFDGAQISASIISGVEGNQAGKGRSMGMIAGILSQRGQEHGITREEAVREAAKLYDQLETKGTAKNEEIGFEIAAQEWGQWQDEGGVSAAERILERAPGINLLMCENDFMAMGAYKAVEEYGLEDAVLIGCCADGSQECLDAIRAGRLACTG